MLKPCKKFDMRTMRTWSTRRRSRPHETKRRKTRTKRTGTKHGHVTVSLRSTAARDPTARGSEDRGRTDRQLRHVQEVRRKHASSAAPRHCKAACHMWHSMTLLTSRSASPTICWRASQSYNWRRAAAKPLAVAWSVSWSLLQMQLCHQLCHRNPPVQLFGPRPKGASSNTSENKMYIFSYQTLLAIEKSWKVDDLDLAAYSACGEPCDEDQVEGEQQTADDRLASKSWLWHCSEKNLVCDYSGVPAGQCARNCCCIWSCWLLLAGWLYSYKP